MGLACRSAPSRNGRSLLMDRIVLVYCCVKVHHLVYDRQCFDELLLLLVDEGFVGVGAADNRFVQARRLSTRVETPEVTTPAMPKQKEATTGPQSIDKLPVSEGVALGFLLHAR
jgi:hypothetical protein